MTGAAGSFDKLLVAPVGRGNVSSTHGGTCDAEVGVGGARGDGAAPAGRDGGVCGRGLGAGWAVAGFAGRPDAEELNGRADRLECWVVALMSVNRACGERVPA